MRRAGISTWTVVALTAATLALGGCGRKGGLDLPPTVSVGPTDYNGAPAGTAVDPSVVNDAGPVAAPRGGERGKRSFLLDPLLGN